MPVLSGIFLYADITASEDLLFAIYFGAVHLYQINRGKFRVQQKNGNNSLCHFASSTALPTFQILQIEEYPSIKLQLEKLIIFEQLFFAVYASVKCNFSLIQKSLLFPCFLSAI